MVVLVQPSGVQLKSCHKLYHRSLDDFVRRLAGDFGFDPLGLGQEPQDLRWYVQAELVHARFAMAGVAGILFTDVCSVSKLHSESRS